MTKPTQDMSEQELERAAEEYAGLTKEMKAKGFYVHDTMEGQISAFIAGARHQKAKDAAEVEELKHIRQEQTGIIQQEFALGRRLREEITSLRAELAESRDDCQHLKMLLDAANQELADAKEKLEVAVEALQYYGSNDNWFKELGQGIDLFPKEFRLIDDVDVREIKDNGRSSSVGGKRAVEALAKLRGKKVVE